jgi:uncharacterized membrane protein YcaP (DUF421 family)
MSAFGILIATAVRTGLVAAALLIGLRLTGKRQAGEGNLRDLLLALLVANAVQNAMTKGDGRLSVALVSAATLILLGWLLAAVISRRPNWEGSAMGGPTVVVADGHVLRPIARREGLSENDLMAAVRDQGLSGVADVRLAVLEMDGSISVIPRDKESKA